MMQGNGHRPHQDRLPVTIGQQKRQADKDSEVRLQQSMRQLDLERGDRHEGEGHVEPRRQAARRGHYQESRNANNRQADAERQVESTEVERQTDGDQFADRQHSQQPAVGASIKRGHRIACGAGARNRCGMGLRTDGVHSADHAISREIRSVDERRRASAYGAIEAAARGQAQKKGRTARCAPRKRGCVGPRVVRLPALPAGAGRDGHSGHQVHPGRSRAHPGRPEPAWHHEMPSVRPATACRPC